MRGTEKYPLAASDLRSVLREIQAGVKARDANPEFPHAPFQALAASGVLAMPVPEPTSEAGRRASFSEEWRVLRAVARADGSVGRILDGHLNGVERVAALAPENLRSNDLEAIASGELLLGVWGADPIPGEGAPARLIETEYGPAIDGVKTFCSGSTGLDRALVAVRAFESEGQGPPLLVYVALDGSVEVDEGWFRGSGLRASESHRVVFQRTPVLAVLGGRGELIREPYFSRDAVRTAVTWAGITDSAVDAAIEILTAKSGGEPDDVVSLAAGKMLAAQGTIDRWLEYASRFADENPEDSMSHFSIHLRESIAAACRGILDEAARAVGSHPFATAGDLDRARRDLDLFLLQHRLEPALARAGRHEIQARASAEGEDASV